MYSTQQPKFTVGEVVLLVCKDFPEDNGEFTVEGMEFSKDFEYFNSPVKLDKAEWMYKLSNGLEYWYFEDELRKKHNGSEYSFTQLMDVLKSPVQIES